MDQLFVHLIRPPEQTNYGLINEVKMKLEFCSELLDRLENNEKIMPGKQEDLVIKLKIWLLEGDALSIKVVMQLTVELSLKENIYAELFIKHEFYLLLVGLIDVKARRDNELAILCCLLLHNLLARGSLPLDIAPELLRILVNLAQKLSSDAMLKLLAIQAIGMINTYLMPDPTPEMCRLVSDFCKNLTWDFAEDPAFSLSPPDLIRLLDSQTIELNHLGVWLLAHGEASPAFDWKFVALQLESMTCLNWDQHEHAPFFHFYHLAVSNMDNVTPGIWNKIFNSTMIKVRRRCQCQKLVVHGFDDQFIIPEKPKPIEDIEIRLFANNNQEEHSNSETPPSGD